MRSRTLAAQSADVLISIGFLGGILLMWEVFVHSMAIPNYLLPPPSMILSVMVRHRWSLGNHMAITMLEATCGFILANLLSFMLAIAFAHSRIIEKGLYPYAIALKTTPIIAMAPLLVIWLGSGIVSKVIASALICFFPILVNSVKGLRAVDDEALDLFESLNASSLQILVKLRLPNSLPYVFSALKISTSLSIVGAIVGEFVGANKGLGYVILVSSYHLEADMMFAATAASALGGVAFFGLVAYLEERILYWQEPLET